MDRLQKQFEADPWPVVGFLTTEHTTLTSLRSAAISEANGRVSAYLATVSASLITLGFIASDRGFDTTFYVVGAVLLALLLLIGIVTFTRCLQTSVEDLQLVTRIERLRATYLELAPGLNDRFAPTIGNAADPRSGSGMDAPGWWQLGLTLAGLVGIVTSFVGGALLAFVVYLAVGGVAAAWLGGVVAFCLGMIIHTRIQARAFVQRAPSA